MIEPQNVHLKPCWHDGCAQADGEVLHVLALDADNRLRVIGHVIAGDDGWSVVYQSEHTAIWNGRTIALGKMPKLRDVVVLLMATANASDVMHVAAATRPVDDYTIVQAWRR